MINLITEKQIPNLPICAATAPKRKKNIYHRLQQHQHHAGTSIQYFNKKAEAYVEPSHKLNVKAKYPALIGG
jgi:hypothetical protein